jgi:hypothetical protein
LDTAGFLVGVAGIVLALIAMRLASRDSGRVAARLQLLLDASAEPPPGPSSTVTSSSASEVEAAIMDYLRQAGGSARVGELLDPATDGLVGSRVQRVAILDSFLRDSRLELSGPFRSDGWVRIASRQ